MDSGEKTATLQNPKIYAAIAGVISDCGFVSKDKVNKQQGFKYRSVDDVFNALHPALAKNKVFIVPTILERKEEVIGQTAKGAKIIKVVCKIKFTFYGEDGSSFCSIIYGEGMDMGDKATNKAMAIAYKYLCFQVFCIPTEEMSDPDAESLEGEIENQTPTNKKQNVPKNEAPKKNEAQPKENVDVAENDKITPVMLTTIRKEQTRTGVTDSQILAMHDVKAKKIEDMTVLEYKKVMNKFQKTPDLKREVEQSE